MKGLIDIGIKVLSLFDGMSCGMIAFQKMGIDIDEYHAYEIDKYAIKTSKHNFPEIIHHGDVFEGDFKEYKGFDYLVGGSPCTFWSIAQSKDKRETTASGIGWELFSQYVRALHEAQPKYFLYENNKSMSKDIYKSISDTFGFEPICINSALVSAQNRQRLYWVGKRNPDGTYSKADIEQPKDRGILLRDVLDGMTDREKGRAVIGSTGRTTDREYFKKSQGNMTFEPVGTTKEEKAYSMTANYSYGSGENIGNYVAHTLTKGCKSMVAEPVKELSEKEMDYMVRETKPTFDGRWNYCQRPAQDDKSKCLVANVSKGVPYNVVAEPVNLTKDDKAQCIRATCYKDGIRNIVGNNVDKRTGVAEPVVVGVAQRGRYKSDGDTEQHYETREDDKANCITTVHKDSMVCQQIGALPRPNGELSTSQAFRIYSPDAKGVTLKAGGGGAGGKTGLYAIPVEFENGIPTKAISYADGKTYRVYRVKNGLITIKDKEYPIKLIDGYYIIRKLTVSECKRLQTVPEWFDFPVSDTQAYKCLGNGWTVDVIVHLLEATVN